MLMMQQLKYFRCGKCNYFDYEYVSKYVKVDYVNAIFWVRMCLSSLCWLPILLS